jgi:methyl-accepting chemotaxis protein
LPYLFQRLTIVAKLRILALTGILFLMAMAVWQGFDAHQRGYEARQKATRNTVELAHGVVAWAQGMESSGKLSREAAQDLAKSALSGMRYGNGEYFWINDMTPRVVMHPIKPELNGTEVSNMKDPNGLAIFVAFADKVRKDKEGFVPYLWPKPGQDTPVEKLSYVKGFAPWGWVIGSGIYIDDLRAELLVYIEKLAAIAGVALVLTVFLTISITRSIVSGLNKAVRVARAIAKGDISQVIRVRNGHDEVGQLLSAMRDMSANLRHMVGMVQESAGSIQVAASEIADGNADLSSRTEQTASSLQQTAAAMSQIHETVTRNAGAADQAGVIVAAASRCATDGSQLVAQVGSTMDEITHSSRRITDIISVIDGIAFQTNILALNAAVEAARAGEHGRGFAVVASEVRTLATRSAQAAREIKTLISDSVSRVEAGGQLVSGTDATMRQLLDSVQQVTQLVDTMRNANHEQAVGVGQVNTAVSSLDQMTQQNSALVEQSAAAAASLRDQARTMLEAVKVFQLEAVPA